MITDAELTHVRECIEHATGHNCGDGECYSKAEQAALLDTLRRVGDVLDAIDGGSLPEGVPFFADPTDKTAVSLQYVQHLREVMGLSKGQSLVASLRTLVDQARAKGAWDS